MANRMARPVLSVGMIVKNEERNLEGCLRALRPLLETVPSELIIADTGSTDATREIAARYTNAVFEFPWKNDFAAARNATLDRAKGEWYLYVDADESFGDVSELVSFLLDAGERKKYGMAAYLIRNYEDWEQTRYTDLLAARLYRRGPETRFYSKIHEYIPPQPPQKDLRVIAHHTGYVSEPGAGNRKAERNIPLLLEALREQPDYPARLCYQLAREYGSLKDYEAARSYLRMGLEQLSPGDLELRRGLYHDLADIDYQESCWNGVLTAVDAYFSEADTGSHITDMDMRYMAAKAFISMNHPDKALDESRAYLRLEALLRRGELNEGDRGMTQISYAHASDLAVMRFCEADCLIRLGRAKEAFGILDVMLTQGSFTPSLHVYEMERACVAALKLWDRYPGRYLSLRGDETALGRIRAQITELMESDPEARQGIGEAFVRAGAPLDDWFAALCRLRGRKEVPDEALAPLLSGMPSEPECAELLYYAMKRKLDIAPFVNRVDSDDLYSFIRPMQDKAAFRETVSDYYAAMPEPTDLRCLRWKFVLLEYLLLKGGPDSPTYRRDFAAYCKSLERYTAEVYGEIGEPVLSVIPRGHRFGIYMARAGHAQAQGDMQGYVRMLQAAITAYPVMAAPVKLLLDEVQDMLKRQQEQDVERASLFVQVKEKIRQLIRMGDHENAEKVLEQYAKLNPKDEAISYFWRQLKNPVEPS